MSKEILFKGKRIDNGEWVEGNIVWSNDAVNEYRTIIIPKEKSNMFSSSKNDDLGFENWYLVDPETICQYIGFTDKNGRKIFEGDVIRYTNEVIGTKEAVYIKYNEFYGGFCRILKSEMGLQYLSIGNVIASSCEVIGNIFDNPELLEGCTREAVSL